MSKPHELTEITFHNHSAVLRQLTEAVIGDNQNLESGAPGIGLSDDLPLNLVSSPMEEADVRVQIAESGYDESIDWRKTGLCSETDPALFFPDKGHSVRPAKSICDHCDVINECLTDALELNERYGVWGGLSERERRVLRHLYELEVDIDSISQYIGLSRKPQKLEDQEGESANDFLFRIIGELPTDESDHSDTPIADAVVMAEQHR